MRSVDFLLHSSRNFYHDADAWQTLLTDMEPGVLICAASARNELAAGVPSPAVEAVSNTLASNMRALTRRLMFVTVGYRRNYVMITPDQQETIVDLVANVRAEVRIDDFLTSDGPILGRYERSPNGDFLLVWCDEWARGHSRTRGPFYLFRGPTELCKGRLQRPNDGRVADNGSFVLCDWLFTDTLTSTFYAFDWAGRVLIKRKFRANLFNASISMDGAYAACQTCVNTASRHSELLTLFDLRSRAEMWHLKPPFWAESYEFDVPRLELTIRGSSRIYKRCVLSLSVAKGNREG